MLRLHTDVVYTYEQLLMDFDDFAEKSYSFDDEYIKQELIEVISLGHKWVKPQLKIWITENFTVNNSTIQVGDIEFQCGKKIASHLRSAEQIALFVATVGDGITQQYHKYTNEADFLKAYFVDRLGSLSVEKAMDLAQKSISVEFEIQGKKISNRFSPGYCGWLVKEQHKLFSLLPEKPCGVILSDSALMNPIKSISGIIAIGENVKYVEHSCSLCNMKKCEFRKLNN